MPRSLTTALRRSAPAVTGAILLAWASPASAHVTVDPETAVAGGDATLTFQVPTEKNAPTTKVEVAFPAAQPLAFVAVKPHPGWSYAVVKAKLATPISSDSGPVSEAVSQITWSAQAGQGIKPGEFDAFQVSVGPLPKSGAMVFKALQTYADGSVVRWIDPTVQGQPEPEHPAPVLHLTTAGAGSGASAGAAGSGSASPSAAPGSPSATATPVSVAAVTTDPRSWDGRGIAWTALVVAGIAALLAAGSLAGALRRRRG